MDPARIGIVKFLNTVPLVDGLEKTAGLTLVPAAPSHLAGMLERGEVDIALVSTIDAAESKVPLSLLSCGMIGSDGPTLTVRLFSSIPISQITTLHADADSHTSITLARLVLRKAFNKSVTIAPFNARELADPASIDWPQAVLLIGDKVVNSSPPAVPCPYQLDLGEEWKKLTGLPFVYALWMCRTQDLAEPARREKILLAQALLDRQLRHNLTRIDRIIQDRAPAFRWPIDLARRYLGELLRYRVGPTEKQAVTRFLEEAAIADILDTARATNIHWA